jgi:isopenicillin N synthase-like dioxygenase
LDQVPVIDISPYLEGDEKGRKEVVESVEKVNKEIGFMVISGHGVSNQLIKRMRSESKKFFHLPLETKMKYKGSPGQFRGYFSLGSTALGYHQEKKAQPDLREYFALGPFDFVESAATNSGFWPVEVPGMKDPWLEYFHTTHNLSKKIMRIFALAVNLPETFFDDKVDNPAAYLQVTHSPPLSEPPLPGQLRAAPHTDYGTVTILHTDPECPQGLQVKIKDQWTDIPYIPDSFVVNTGDMLTRWTNDHWVSTPHRVVNPTPEYATRERMTIPFFLNANDDAIVEVIPACTGPNNPPKYGRITARDYLAMKARQVNTPQISKKT